MKTDAVRLWFVDTVSIVIVIMIKIYYYKDGFKITGHTGPKGKSIVCAGVSAIVQTAIIGIGQVANIPQTITEDKDSMETKWESRNIPLAVIEKTMKLGLAEIEKNYSDCVRIVDLSDV